MICNNNVIIDLAPSSISSWQNALYNVPYRFRRLRLVIHNVIVRVSCLPSILEIVPNSFVVRLRFILNWNAPHSRHEFWLSASIHRHERFDVLLRSIFRVLPLCKYTFEVYNCADLG